MKIYVGRIALYGFSLVIIYLAGVYFGTFLYVLYIFFLLLPLMSILLLIVQYISIRPLQEFSTFYPVKGEKVRYRLFLMNRGFFPIVSLDVHFISISPALDSVLSDFHTIIPIRDEVARDYEIQCPYRGTYSLGISKLVVHDLLHFIALKRSAAPITFSVYPRIIAIDKFSPLAATVEKGSASSGLQPDTTLFYQLREYRDGEPVKHVYWKKYASTGKPFLKEYETTGGSGVRIYLDLRRMRHNYTTNILEQADVSVETLVALVKYFLDAKVPTTVIAPGLNPSPFIGRDAADFYDFYRATPPINADGAVSPAALIQLDNSSGSLSSQTIIIITHNLDPQLFSLSGGSVGSAKHIHYIVNSVGYSRTEKEKIKTFIKREQWRGMNIVEVTNIDSLTGDLMGQTRDKI